jgi:hypothetical protein
MSAVAKRNLLNVILPTTGQPTPPPTPAPVYTVNPAITASAIVHTENVGTQGTASNADSYAQQWQQSPDGVGSWTDIAGATALNYTPTPALYQSFLRRRETATGAGGSTVAYSNVSFAVSVPPMTFQVTTTGVNQTLTIAELRTVLNEEVEVTWGDGQSNFYMSTGSTGNQRTHLYAAAGTYNVSINPADLITHLDIRDTKISQVTGANVSVLRNLTNLRILTVPATALQWTVNEAAPMLPLLQYLQIEIQNNFVWTVNGDFPPINDVLNLRSLPGLTWLISAANPLPPLADSITIRDSAGVDYQRVSTDGAAGAAWRLNTCDIIRIETGFTTQMIDDLLLDLYAVFPFRTVPAGTIDLLGGTPANQAPSGVLAAQCPPVTGRAAAYELVNDSCGVSANHWTSVTTA